MSEEVLAEVSHKKEAAVLSEDSLAALAKEVASSGMVIGMYLSIPTTTLVNMGLEACSSKHTDEQTAEVILKHWKAMRATAKDKDKVSDLERALREAGKQEHADVFIDRHRDNMQLTADCFPAQ